MPIAKRRWRNTTPLVFVLLVTTFGCAPAGPSAGPQGNANALTIPVLNVVNGFSPIGFGFSSPTGGADGITEMHSQGLLTSPPTTRDRIGLLADKVPSLDD